MFDRDTGMSKLFWCVFSFPVHEGLLISSSSRLD